MLAAYRAFIDYIVAAGQYCGGGAVRVCQALRPGGETSGRCALRLMPSSAQQSIFSKLHTLELERRVTGLEVTRNGDRCDLSPPGRCRLAPRPCRNASAVAGTLRPRPPCAGVWLQNHGKVAPDVRPLRRVS